MLLKSLHALVVINASYYLYFHDGWGWLLKWAFSKKVAEFVRASCLLSLISVTVLRIFVLSIWWCSLGPNGPWRDTAYAGHKRWAKESYIRPGAWVNYVLYSVITTCRLIVKIRTSDPNVSAQRDSYTSASSWYLVWYTQHVCFIISATSPFFRKYLLTFFFLAYIELFIGVCLSTALYTLYHRNSLVF